MSTPHAVPSLMQWVLMTEMEKMVWAATFAHAQNAGNATEATLSADQAVENLRTVNPEWRLTIPAPEYEAARAGGNIEWDDFRVWYRVAFQIRFGKESTYRERGDQECADAYERFKRSSCDYY